MVIIPYVLTPDPRYVSTHQTAMYVYERRDAIWSFEEQTMFSRKWYKNIYTI